jgi:hypothetical protein
MVQPAAMTFAGGPVRMQMRRTALREAFRTAPAAPVKIDSALRSANGVIRVQIWLADTQPATLAALKKLGFELTGSARTAKLVIGRVDAVKLQQIAALAAVKWIAPAP